ncbi:MAG: hypothetical protein OHK0029_30260 [Armatimonadaceae bacterium]
MSEAKEPENSTLERTEESGSRPPMTLFDEHNKAAIITVGVVAAVVSAATVAYVFWWRSRHLTPKVESVQQLLDRCHTQVRDIQEKLGELSASA